MQTINTGTTANDSTGDPLRTAFIKVNANFVEVTPKGGSADPSAGAGVVAPLYATYSQVVSGALVRAWVKVGALDTDWA